MNKDGDETKTDGVSESTPTLRLNTDLSYSAVAVRLEGGGAVKREPLVVRSPSPPCGRRSLERPLVLAYASVTPPAVWVARLPQADVPVEVVRPFPSVVYL